MAYDNFPSGCQNDKLRKWLMNPPYPCTQAKMIHDRDKDQSTRIIDSYMASTKIEPS